MDFSNKNLRFAGDVSVDYVEIISSTGFIQNVTKQVIGVSVFEHLFNPFITGNIVMKDALDLINLFPIVGDELIRFKITTPGINDDKKAISGKFRIYKMTEREELTDKSVVYVLHFISLEAIVDLNKKISKTFEGRCSDIAKDIISKSVGLNTEKNYNIEDTPNGTKFISNFWSPVKCINYVTSNAVNKNNSPTYLFFENRYGFHFVSLESMYTNPITQTFIYDNYANSEGRKNPEESFKRISYISIPDTFDYVSDLSSGMYASRLITYDLVTKKYSSKNYNMLDNFANKKHLNTYPIANDKLIAGSNAAIMNRIKTYGNFNNYGDVTNNKIVQNRASLLAQLETTKISITVPGRTDYTVGQKVYLKLYKKNQTTAEGLSDDDIDKVFSGNYLVAGIHHNINKDRHECYIDIVRESLLIDLNKGK